PAAARTASRGKYAAARGTRAAASAADRRQTTEYRVTARGRAAVIDPAIATGANGHVHRSANREGRIVNHTTGATTATGTIGGKATAPAARDDMYFHLREAGRRRESAAGREGMNRAHLSARRRNVAHDDDTRSA